MQDSPDAKPPAGAQTMDAESLLYAQRVFLWVRSGDVQALLPLLARGLPANLPNEGDGLLMLASYNGHLDAARLLLEHGADPEIRNDRGQTPVAAAAFRGDREMVELLGARGANVQARDARGLTAQQAAPAMGAPDTLEQLARMAG